MSAERAAAVRYRVAENRRRLLRLQAWSNPQNRPLVRTAALQNDHVETTFLQQAAEAGGHADIWLVEAERWLRVHVDPHLEQLERELDGESAVSGPRTPMIVKRRRHSLV